MLVSFKVYKAILKACLTMHLTNTIYCFFFRFSMLSKYLYILVSQMYAKSVIEPKICTRKLLYNKTMYMYNFFMKACDNFVK